ncbi:MAG: chemotaxis response regulator protein-glutamate methylesterase, partial [Spirochaetota bacterium]|nr:chemotaxis response regulator protein-glutamate methylesterase [Spirochaetota bacterium]
NPLPVIIVSSISKSGSENALKALSYGAVDVFGKPGGPYSVGDLKSELVNKVKSIGKSSFKYRYNENLNEKKYTPISASKLSQKTKKIIAIGASTGGTEAIKDVIYRLPQNIPGIIIVQHMPEYFIKPYADRLNSDCNLNVKVAQHNDKITEGTVYVAPFGSHTIVKKNANDYFIELKDGPFVHHQKPSASVLFKSLAMSAGSEAIGVILTGMGKDGSTGLLEMKEAGSYNIAQDEESCVIFGMPKEAINNGSIHKIAPLNTIAEEIVNILSINILT